MARGQILVVDDDSEILASLEELLEDEGYQPVTALGGVEAVQLLRQRPFDLVMTDLKMPEMDGLAALAAIKEIDPSIPVIVATAHATVDTAIASMKQGAYDYVEKPFSVDKLLMLIDRALEFRALQAQEQRMRADLEAARARLLQVERLGVAASLAGGIAHEVNNPLTYVHGNLVLLKEYARDLERAGSDPTQKQIVCEMNEVLAESLEGVKRIRDLIVAFRRLAEPSTAAPSPLTTGDLLDAALANTGFDTARVIRDPGPPHATQGVPADLVEAIRLILGFALEHHANGEPPIRVRSESADERPDIVVVVPGLRLTPEEQQNIFDAAVSASAQERRMRLDMRLLVASHLLLRNDAQPSIEKRADQICFRIRLARPAEGD